MRRRATAVLACCFLLPAGYVSADDEGMELQRVKLMSSKLYASTCKRIGKPSEAQIAEAEALGQPRLLCRMPPNYPEKCFADARPVETVKLRYDVRPDGYTTNLRMIEASYDCVVEPAAGSLLLWKYEPSESGAKDLETEIRFELGKPHVRP
ncbi:MAG: hypothetical protein VX640_12865 [Pseudomonadota bacterium]|nr:hypothetical protein [Pseudomonadota bacterium]